MEKQDTIGTRACDWEVYRTDDGKVYYFNVVTRKSQWGKPDVLKEERKTSEKIEKAPPFKVTEANENGQFKKTLSQKITQSQFLKLLEETVPSEDWTWLNTVKKIGHDPRFKMVKSVEERKSLFENFMREKRNLNIRSKKKREQKRKQEFLHLLKSMKLDSKCRFSDILGKLKESDSYSSFDNHDQRLRIFDEFIVQLEKDEKREKIEKRRKKTQEFKSLLEIKEKQGFITSESLWRDVRKMLEKEKEYKQLDSLTRMRTWEQYISNLEKKEKMKVSENEKLKKTKDRQTRADFWHLLMEKESEGSIHVDSVWKNDVRTKVKNSGQYKKVREIEDGPMPKDLFYEFVDDLEIKYQKEKKIIKKIMENQKTSFGDFDNFDQFLGKLKEDEMFHEIEGLGNIQTYYTHMIRRKKKRDLTEMKNIFLKIDMDISTTFEDALEKVQDNEKFIGSGTTDDEKRSCFEKVKRKKLKRKRNETKKIEPEAKIRKVEEKKKPNEVGVLKSKEISQDLIDDLFGYQLKKYKEMKQKYK